jgi:hypothetical protein
MKANAYDDAMIAVTSVDIAQAVLNVCKARQTQEAAA